MSKTNKSGIRVRVVAQIPLLFFFALTVHRTRTVKGPPKRSWRFGEERVILECLMTLAAVYARKYGERQSPASGSKQQKTSFMGVFFVLPPSAWTRTAKGLPQISNLWEGASDA